MNREQWAWAGILVAGAKCGCMGFIGLCFQNILLVYLKFSLINISTYI